MKRSKLLIYKPEVILFVLALWVYTYFYQAGERFLRLILNQLIQNSGNLPRRALRLVQDWIELHSDELFENWEEAQKDNPNIKKIEALR